MMIRVGLRGAITALALLLALPARPCGAEEILIFAAASLKNALDDAAQIYEKESGDKIVVSYAASSVLAKQIDAGAPADLFISADLDWMDFLAQKGLIKPETRKAFLGNRLALIAPAASTLIVTIAPDFPVARLLGDGRLALADPDSVPAGKYAKAALQKLGVWSSVEGKLAPAENVRAALLLVSRQETPLGIVYKSDATADKNVKVLAIFPADTHPPIIYPMALTASTAKPVARKFLDYLESPAARPSFENQGFSVQH